MLRKTRLLHCAAQGLSATFNDIAAPCGCCFRARCEGCCDDRDGIPLYTEPAVSMHGKYAENHMDNLILQQSFPGTDDSALACQALPA